MPARSTKDLPVTLLTYGVAQCLVATPESFEVGASTSSLILDVYPCTLAM